MKGCSTEQLFTDEGLKRPAFLTQRTRASLRQTGNDDSPSSKMIRGAQVIDVRGDRGRKLLPCRLRGPSNTSAHARNSAARRRWRGKMADDKVGDVKLKRPRLDGGEHTALLCLPTTLPCMGGSREACGGDESPVLGRCVSGGVSQAGRGGEERSGRDARRPSQPSRASGLVGFLRTRIWL